MERICVLTLFFGYDAQLRQATPDNFIILWTLWLPRVDYTDCAQEIVARLFRIFSGQVMTGQYEALDEQEAPIISRLNLINKPSQRCVGVSGSTEPSL